MNLGGWGIFGGAGAAPVPKDEPQEEHKTEEARMEEALHRNARRKCGGMSMMNHITAWNSLAGLKGAHRAKLESMKYSASTFWHDYRQKTHDYRSSAPLSRSADWLWRRCTTSGQSSSIRTTGPTGSAPCIPRSFTRRAWETT